MGKNDNLEEGRNKAIGLLNDSLLQMEEKFEDSMSATKDAYGKVNTRLATSEKQSFFSPDFVNPGRGSFKAITPSRYIKRRKKFGQKSPRQFGVRRKF